MEKIRQMIASGVMKVKFTRHSKYPIITINKKLICESELADYGFISKDEFLDWYNDNYNY